MAPPVFYLLILTVIPRLVCTQLILPGDYLLCTMQGCYTIPEFQLEVCRCRVGGFLPEVCADSLIQNQSSMANIQMTLNNITSLTNALIFTQQASSCEKISDDVPITVVSSCPMSSKMADIVNCEQTTERLPPVDYIGAIDITFKNIHCAVCHGLDLDVAESQVAPWSVSYNCTDFHDGGNNMAAIFRDSTCQAVYEPRDYDDKFCSIIYELDSVLRNDCFRCLDLVQANVSTDGVLSCLICQFAVESSRQYPQCPDPEAEGSLMTLFQLPRESEKRIKINQQVFKISEVCADDEKFDDLFQKCRQFKCKTDEYAKSGECWKNSTIYVPSSSQPFPNGTDVIYVNIVKKSEMEFGESFGDDFQKLATILDSQWNLLIINRTQSEAIEGSALIRIDLEKRSTIDFLDSFSNNKIKRIFVDFYFTFYNYQNASEFKNCIVETLHCTTNATVFFVKENWFARMKDGNITLLYPMENILFRTTANSKTDGIAVEEVCVCPHTDASTVFNCSHALYVYTQDEYEFDANGELQIVGHHQRFSSEEFYISDSNAFVCYNPDKTHKFFTMDDIQKYVSWACSSVSIICLIVTIIVYFLSAKLNVPAKLNIGLAVSLISGQILLVIPAGEDITVCRYIAAVTHFSWLSAFAWMSAQALQMLITFHPKTIRVSSSDGNFRYYCLACVGVPMVMALVCLILDLVPGDHSKVQYGASSCTWLSSRSGYIYAFFVPIGISLVFNFVCFIMTLYFIEKAMASTEVTIGKKRDKKRCLMYVRLSSVMGFTWIFGFIASTTNISVLWYVYIILNGLQGVFIFLSFCLNSRNKDMIKAKMSESRFTNIFTANTETTSARSKTDDEDTKQVTSRKI